MVALWLYLTCTTRRNFLRSKVFVMVALWTAHAYFSQFYSMLSMANKALQKSADVRRPGG